MHIIPAIDIIEGKCVRLTQGDYSQKTTYNEDPLEVAQAFADAGLQRLHLVDLDGARAGRIVNYRVLEKLAARTSLHIDFGGGLKSDDDLRIAFDSGAAQVTGGTIAVKAPELFLHWLETYGPERIILGADARDNRIAVSGWQEDSGLDIDAFLLNYSQKGIRYAISTDVRKDGMMAGPSLDLYRRIRETLPGLALIASGGVSQMDDLHQLRELGCFGAIVGKAIYEGTITLAQLEAWASA
jgi:phosphoribosylformimino-5-aminoimidazole carboxamide ribotide isomerase